MSSAERSYSRSTSSNVMPPARLPTTKVTGTREPRITGFPWQMDGSRTMRGCSVISETPVFAWTLVEIVAEGYGRKRLAHTRTCAYRLCHPNVVPVETAEPSDWCDGAP